MIGKITDEHSMQTIVMNGIIPSISDVLNSKETVGRKVYLIGNLIDCYNQFYLTGRQTINKEEATKDAKNNM